MRAEEFTLKKNDTDFTYVCMDIANELGALFVATEGADVATEWFSSVKEAVATSQPVTPPGNDIYQKITEWVAVEMVKRLNDRQLSLEGMTSDQRSTTFLSVGAYVMTCTPVTYSMKSSNGSETTTRLMFPIKYVKKDLNSNKYNVPVLNNIVNTRVSKKMAKSGQFLLVTVTSNNNGVKIVVNPAHSR